MAEGMTVINTKFGGNSSGEVFRFCANLTNSLLPEANRPSRRIYKYTREELFAIRDHLPPSNPDFLKHLPPSISLYPLPQQDATAMDECVSMTDEDEFRKLQEVMEASDYYHTAEYITLKEKRCDPVWESPTPTFQSPRVQCMPAPPVAYYQPGPSRRPYRPYEARPLRPYQMYDAQEAAMALSRLTIVVEEAKFNSVAAAALEPYDHGTYAHRAYQTEVEIEEIIDEEM